MSKRVGFIGLGQMGKWMALNLGKAGLDLAVYDVSAQAVQFLAEHGVPAAASPAELAARSEWLFLSLPDTEIVERVVFGPDGVVQGAQSGLILVDCGTTNYLATIDFARRLGECGVRFADMPVSGMEARSRDGTLTIMCGGDVAILEEVRPALQAMGNKIIHMGELGSGQLTKLINQLLFNINCAALAEVLPMAVRLGLDPEKVSEVVKSGTGRSFAAEFFIPNILEDRFDQGYPLQHAYKDMVSAAEICAHRQIPLPLVHAATTTYQMALLAGLGSEDKGAMIKVFERILDVQFRKGGDGA